MGCTHTRGGVALLPENEIQYRNIRVYFPRRGQYIAYDRLDPLAFITVVKKYELSRTTYKQLTAKKKYDPVIK